MMKDWKIQLWTPGHTPADDRRTFGCASNGIAAPEQWHEPDTCAVTTWPTQLRGHVLAGRYANVLTQLGELSQKPSAAIVLFAQATGMEAFLERWQGLMSGVPVVGGSAARGTGQSTGDLLPPAEDVAVLLITEGSWRAESLNVHDQTNITMEFRAEGSRTITELRQIPDGTWESAAAFFRARQKETGRQSGDCESLTLSDTGGRNMHISFDGETLYSGADLPTDNRLSLRTVSQADVAKRLTNFCAEPGALVFGCAGLRSLLEEPTAVAEATLVAFMFGELVTLHGQPQFGNLMAARLVPTAK